MKEFQLIEAYFKKQNVTRRDVLLSIGDDCALVELPEQKVLAISCDTLVENIHFLKDIPPQALGYKSLAVNLSDLAAMGAEPAWMTLAITLPNVDEDWLTQYSAGLFEAAEYYNVALIGGDTTQGPLSININVHGHIPKGKELTRSGAKIGDWIYVTGTLGDSALGLDIIKGNQASSGEHHDYLVNRHYYPSPRVLAGQALRGLATSAIDLSDGLASDLKHMLHSSGIGGVISVDKLPLSIALTETVSPVQAIDYALCGGEDYELLFTVPESQRGALETTLSHAGVKCVQIGQIVSGTGLTFEYQGKAFTPQKTGFEHFS